MRPTLTNSLRLFRRTTTWFKPREVCALATIGVVFVLSGCGGGASTSASAVVAALTVANASVVEGNAGTTNLVFTVTSSIAATTAIAVAYATADGTATAGQDYTATNGTLNIAIGATSGTVTVPVSGDTVIEADETFTLVLTAPANATVTGGIITGTILNDDAGLNDTGITLWGDAVSNTLAVTQPLFPVQDADVGRDVNPATNSNADGKAGFSFTKLDAAGQALANQAAVYGTTPWDCVQDHVTGLMWEVKTTTPSSLRNNNNTYTWFNSTGINDGGSPGTAAAIPACTTGGSCDTEKYVAAVNALTGANRLCGFTDWRLPKVGELYSIVDKGIATPDPTVDTGYLPNTIGSVYWSASSYAGNATAAWNVGFDNGDASPTLRRIPAMFV